MKRGLKTPINPIWEPTGENEWWKIKSASSSVGYTTTKSRCYKLQARNNGLIGHKFAHPTVCNNYQLDYLIQEREKINEQSVANNLPVFPIKRKRLIALCTHTTN